LHAFSGAARRIPLAVHVLLRMQAKEAATTVGGMASRMSALEAESALMAGKVASLGSTLPVVASAVQVLERRLQARVGRLERAVQRQVGQGRRHHHPSPGRSFGCTATESGAGEDAGCAFALFLGAAAAHSGRLWSTRAACRLNRCSRRS
jgi:hypothetical protein